MPLLLQFTIIQFLQVPIALTLLNWFGINYEINYTYTFTLDCFWITGVIISARRVGDYMYSFQGALKVVIISVAASLLCQQQHSVLISTRKNSPQGFQEFCTITLAGNHWIWMFHVLRSERRVSWSERRQGVVLIRGLFSKNIMSWFFVVCGSLGIGAVVWIGWWAGSFFPGKNPDLLFPVKSLENPTQKASELWKKGKARRKNQEFLVKQKARNYKKARKRRLGNTPKSKNYDLAHKSASFGVAGRTPNSLQNLKAHGLLTASLHAILCVQPSRDAGEHRSRVAENQGGWATLRIRAALPVNEVSTKDSLLSYEISYKKHFAIFPMFLGVYFVGFELKSTVLVLCFSWLFFFFNAFGDLKISMIVARLYLDAT